MAYFEQAVLEMLRVARRGILLGDLRRKGRPSGRRETQVDAELKHFTIRPFDILVRYPTAILSKAYYEHPGKSFNACILCADLGSPMLGSLLTNAFDVSVLS